MNEVRSDEGKKGDREKRQKGKWRAQSYFGFEAIPTMHFLLFTILFFFFFVLLLADADAAHLPRVRLALPSYSISFQPFDQFSVCFYFYSRFVFFCLFFSSVLESSAGSEW